MKVSKQIIENAIYALMDKDLKYIREAEGTPDYVLESIHEYQAAHKVWSKLADVDSEKIEIFSEEFDKIEI